MNLFDDKKRTHGGPADHAESSWEYLDRSARQDVRHIRSLLNEWFQLVPSSHQYELKSNFQSDFEAAFFELYLFRMLTYLGYRVKIHPSLPHTQRSPDFYATRDGVDFFLEATVARDESDEESRRRAVAKNLYDYLNELHSPYFLRISRLEIDPNAQPKLRAIKAFLKREAKERDPDLTSAGNGLHNYPTVRFQDPEQDPEVLIDFQLIPKPLEIRDDPTKRNIGLYPPETRWGGVTSTVRSSVLNKSTRYGELPKPYVVAVNINSHWFDWSDAVNALSGDLNLVSRGPGTPDVAKRGTGVWHGPRAPQNTRLSAVLVSKVHPWSMGDERPKLFHHPWGRQPLPQGALPVDVWIPEGTIEPRFSSGRSPKDLVGVEAGWPSFA